MNSKRHFSKPTISFPCCFSEILKSYACRGIEPSIFYFRTKEHQPSEIDVILQENNTLYPVEIKKASGWTKAMFGISPSLRPPTWKSEPEHC